MNQTCLRVNVQCFYVYQESNDVFLPSCYSKSVGLKNKILNHSRNVKTIFRNEVNNIFSLNVNYQLSIQEISQESNSLMQQRDTPSRSPPIQEENWMRGAL